MIGLIKGLPRKVNMAGSPQPIVTFTSNVSGLYIPEILAYIQATQAGTGDPYPAGGGVNKWDEEWELGSFDSTGNPIPSTTSIRSKNYIPVEPSTSYYFLFNDSNSAKLYVIQYNAQKEFISYLPSTTGIPSPRAFTTASDCSFITLDFSSAYGTTYLNDCSINYPSTDTSYHPTSNIRPISGVDSLYVTRTGKNLLNPNATVLNAYIDASGNIVSHASNRTVILPCFPNTTYTYTWNRKVISGGDNSLVVSFTSEPTFGSVGTKLATITSTGGNATFTTGASDTYLAIKYANIQNTTPQDTLNDSQLELGSTATSYEQFKGDPYINFFDGLINGTYGYVDLGTLAWSYNSNVKIFYSNSLNAAKPVSINTLANIVCSKYITKKAVNYNEATDKAISIGALFSQGYEVNVTDSAYTDATTFKTAMNGVYLIYELATPTTPTITPIEINMLQSAFGTEGDSAYINLGGTYYGGYLNVTTGVLTVVKAIGVYNGTENWTYYADCFFLENAFDVASTFRTLKSAPLCICNLYKEATSIGSSAELVNIENFSYLNQYGNYYKRLWIKDSRYSNKTDFKAALASNNLQLVYPLATPQTYQLTPAQITQLLGQNNVFCSSGDVEVTQIWARRDRSIISRG